MHPVGCGVQTIVQHTQKHIGTSLQSWLRSMGSFCSERPRHVRQGASADMRRTSMGGTRKTYSFSIPSRDHALLEGIAPTAERADLHFSVHKGLVMTSAFIFDVATLTMSMIFSSNFSLILWKRMSTCLHPLNSYYPVAYLTAPVLSSYTVLVSCGTQSSLKTRGS